MHGQIEWFVAFLGFWAWWCVLGSNFFGFDYFVGNQFVDCVRILSLIMSGWVCLDLFFNHGFACLVAKKMQEEKKHVLWGRTRMFFCKNNEKNYILFNYIVGFLKLYFIEEVGMSLDFEGASVLFWT